ncbi:hypothetical protein GO011_16715 [Mycobacterium sp. 20091114027_K0903767]|nr:hypothetical protein [Mycobacterium sp. 20091114027_K0903767]
MGTLLAANPAPILEQVITNWTAYGQTYGAALQAAGTGLSTYLTTTLPTNVQKLSTELSSGDVNSAAETVYAIFSGLAFSVGFPMLSVFSIPAEITQNIANVAATLGGFGGLVVKVGVSALSMAGGVTQATGASAQAVVDAINDGDPLGALTALAAMPAKTSDAFLNGYSIPAGGFAPGLLSIATPPPPGSPPNTPGKPDGPLAALLGSRLIIATAIGWEDPASTNALSPLFNAGSETPALESAVPNTTAATAVTLSADSATTVESRVKAAAATDAETASADSQTTEATPPEPLKQEAAPFVRKSLVTTTGRADATSAANQPAPKVTSDVRDRISSTVNRIGEGVRKALSNPSKANTAKSDAGGNGSAKHRAGPRNSGNSK